MSTKKHLALHVGILISATSSYAAGNNWIENLPYQDGLQARALGEAPIKAIEEQSKTPKVVLKRNEKAGKSAAAAASQPASGPVNKTTTSSAS
jgi:hypothetical protein